MQTLLELYTTQTFQEGQTERRTQRQTEGQKKSICPRSLIVGGGIQMILFSSGVLDDNTRKAHIL